MRNEYINYAYDLPLRIDLLRIEEYPIHWKDSIEIIYLLEGKIKLGIDEYENILEKGDIEIVNTNESRWIKTLSKSNLCLVINISPNFFESYYSGAEHILFYTDIDPKNKRIGNDKRYIRLKELISILTFEYNNNNKSKNIEKYLLELMYFLLNNFHYLYYEGEDLEDDVFQLERYHRIIRYLNINYMNKITLKEVANMEYMNSQYLSYKIKDIFGLTFNEYLYKIRSNKSVYYLITTDLSISEISRKVGFSHIRYYNKHFKKNYGMNPSDYRKKYSISIEEYNNRKILKRYDLELGLSYISNYLMGYKKIKKQRDIKRIDLDLKENIRYKTDKEYIVNLGEAYMLLEYENMNLIKEMQREIGFKYGIIQNLFSKEMMIYDTTSDFIIWDKIKTLIKFLNKQKIIPIIQLNGLDDTIISKFENNLKDYKYMYFRDLRKNKRITFTENINDKYDKLDVVPYIIEGYMCDKNFLVFNFKDYLKENIKINNDSFFGGNGLVTINGLKKPSYYTFFIMSKLSNEVIHKDNGCIVSSSKEGYQILLYNHPKYFKDKDVKFSINIFNQNQAFKVIKFDLNQHNGSVYDNWYRLGKPIKINFEEKNLLRKYTYPKISYSYENVSNVINISAEISSKSISLIKLNYI